MKKPVPPQNTGPKVAAKISPARIAAFEILTLVGEGKGHSDELLHSARMNPLSPEDKKLATALVMGVLRWQIALDARIRSLLQRPEQRLAEPVALALRLGAFQLLHLDRIPPHAALSESVELCRAAGQAHATGLVNAVLRKFATNKKSSERIFESVAAFAERLGHPSWLVERWVAAYGRETALKICEADQREPVNGVWFRESDGLPQIDDGSRLIAELAAVAAPAAKSIWDTCAAPGGKTLVLAHWLAEGKILATDISAKRMTQTEARFRRYDGAERIRCVVADAATMQAEQKFDLILCDVPCSGTGTLARNPEIRHRIKPEDLPRQAVRQRAILSAALKQLNPGGRLVYSTCSLEPEECEQLVEQAIAGAKVHRVPIEDLLEQLAASEIMNGSVDLNSIVRNGSLRTLPGVHPCDGFFATVLEAEP
ncbi:MAG TPA: transcription antitermination factor NusB [Edaphobacter sp.]|nr:transcription antitermination factor NusB [Edaphobacter sp.]